MWHSLLNYLACPKCGNDLHSKNLDQNLDIPDDWIENGLLLCEGCETAYPVAEGLPVLLTYRTSAADALESDYSDALEEALSNMCFPVGQPEPGEAFVQRSFSREWAEYDYDGVMWDLSYEDHEARFLAECGQAAIDVAKGGLFVEIGCGLGMSTVLGQKHVDGDAIGVDLGFAAGRAASEFKSNRKLHFLQASAFHLPLKPEIADLIYSHGVLHHTYNTERAVKSVSTKVKHGKYYYVWVYGTESFRGSPLRRLAGWVEKRVRPIIARDLDSLFSRTFLNLSATGYLLINSWHRFRDPTVQGYNFRRALHAARDRFTPLFAHRHDANELSAWLRDSGYEAIEVVDWRTMPTANQDNYRRNSGVRGRRRHA